MRTTAGRGRLLLGGEAIQVSETPSNAEGGESRTCACPFCDAPTEKMYPFCKDCGKVLSHCKVCGKPLPPHRDVCGECEE